MVSLNTGNEATVPHGQQLSNVNDNSAQIERLRTIIYTNLDPLITTDYCLLDVPDYSNIGDSLIYAGELSYLKRLPYKELYSCNITRCQVNRIPKGSVILLQGGGNFGDLYRGHQNFRNDIISRFKDNRIIMFPQTVHYATDKFLTADAEIHNAHPDLTLCARDQRTFDFLKKHFHNNNILLVPDMAFCIDADSLSQKRDGKRNRALLFKRTDNELNQSDNLDALIKMEGPVTVDTKDWPVYERTFLEKVLYKVDAMATKYLLDVPLINGVIDPRYGLKGKDYYKRYCSIGVRFIDKYDEVFSTRLHGTILSILMNRKVHIIDNSYGKNSGFYEAWLKDFNNVNLISKN